ncbi:MAG: hypothetical protein J5993_03440 [Clostridia bacterium]|nr:hypothetical protein [Clostridia bacterium]
MEQMEKIILWGCVILVAVGYLTGGIVWIAKAVEKYRKQRSAANSECMQEPEYVYRLARISSKGVARRYEKGVASGVRESQFFFILKFEKEQGEEEYSVSQELFERCEEGTKGTLATINGNFFDFVEDESTEHSSMDESVLYQK